MNTTHHAEIFVETARPKRLMTPRKDLVLAIAVAIPQIVLLLTYHRGSKQDLLGVALFGAFIGSFLGFLLAEAWGSYERALERCEHFRDRLEMNYIEIRGFVFSHAFIVDTEIEEFVRKVLPDDEEARRHHSGLARGFREALDPETYRIARAQAVRGTRYYLGDHGLLNEMVRVAPELLNQEPEEAA